MNIVGISSYFHDSAACLIIDGKIVAAAQEERFTRQKHDSAFPKNSLLYCLTAGALKATDINFIVFYEKPFLKFERIIETYLAFAPKGFKSFSNSLPLWSKEKLFLKYQLIKELRSLFGSTKDWSKILLFSNHHLSHAASAYYPSPFNRAAILTMDAVGEWSTTSIAVGNGSELEILKEIRFPHSLGLLYSAFTYFAGFKVNSGEYKLMGLAPYGEPKYSKLIKDYLIDIKQDGSFALDMNYFNYCTGLTMTNKKFEDLFERLPRRPESEITTFEMNLAASIQQVAEEVVIKMARNIATITGEKNLCLAGGVALNCVINGKILKENIFDKIWIQPAAGDAGGALGAALGVYYKMLNNQRVVRKSLDSMNGSYLGPSYTQNEINARLEECKAIFYVKNEEDLIKDVVTGLTTGSAIGWMDGRMEFGPRSLGNRSIIADPRSQNMQKVLNLKVKFRESFRPFAPSILREDVGDYFELNEDSPYMLLVADVKKVHQLKPVSTKNSEVNLDTINTVRSSIPAVTHIDYSSRIQTVHFETNPKFYKLISEFKRVTGCPLIVNTSFNVRGEPIVCSPEDAYRCFMGTNLDILVVGNAILFKKDQPRALLTEYKSLYPLD